MGDAVHIQSQSSESGISCQTTCPLTPEDTHAPVRLAAVAVADQVGRARQLVLLAADGRRLRAEFDSSDSAQHALNALLRLAHGFFEDVDRIDGMLKMSTRHCSICVTVLLRRM